MENLKIELKHTNISEEEMNQYSTEVEKIHQDLYKKQMMKKSF